VRLGQPDPGPRLKTRRTNVEIRILARINRALRAAATWAQDRAALCALIVICAALLGTRLLLGRLVHGRRAIVALGLALAIPVGVLEYRSHPGTRTTDAPVSFGPARAWDKNESVEENARITKWKRSVEQALIEAEAREPARQHDAATAQDDAATAQDGVDATKQAETLNASNEDRAAAETKAASASSAAKEAITANDAKPADTKRANETKGSEPFSDSSPTAGSREEQTGTSRFNGWSRRAEIFRATKETDDHEVARKNAIARHALTYSWVTTDGAGHSWVHIRPIYYSQKE
jgi:hypothetical protein